MVDPLVAITGAAGVWALPRTVPSNPTRPVVVHLLNRDYNPDTDVMRAKGPFTLRVDARLLAGKTPTGRDVCGLTDTGALR